MAQRRTLARSVLKLRRRSSSLAAGTVGGGRFGGEEFGEQGGDFGGPVRVVVAAGEAGRPGFGVALGAGAQVLAVEFVEAARAEAQFQRRRLGRRVARRDGLGQEVTDEGSAATRLISWCFSWRQDSRRGGFIALKLIPAGASRAAAEATRPAVYQASDGAQVASPQSPILR